MRPTIRVLAFAAAGLVAGCASTDAPQGPGAFDAWRATNATVHERRAEAALQRGDFAEAVQSAREALRVAPDRFESTRLLAKALLCSHRLDEAEPAARRATELAPNDASAWLVLAECLTALGRAADARDAYREATRLGSTDAALVLGATALADGDQATADAVLGADASTPTALGVLASHAWQTGEIDRAAELIDRAFALDPSDARLKLRRDELAFDRGAGSRADASPPAADATPEVRMLHAAEMLEAGDAEGAAEQYRRAAIDLPSDPTVRVALGEALLEAGDRDGAIAAFHAAERIDATCIDAWVGVGRAALAAGRAQDAVAALDHAVKIRPDHLPTRSLLVAASVAAGDRSRAAAEAAEVRMRSPGSRLDRACRELLARTGGTPVESPPGQ